MTVFIQDQHRKKALICPNCNTSNKCMLRMSDYIWCGKCKIPFRLKLNVKLRKPEQIKLSGEKEKRWKEVSRQ